MSETVGGFFIGWDVGAWYCDDKKRSQDSVVILDGDLNIVGSPWRGNLRESLNNATSALDWILTVHRYCEGGEPPENTLFTIAIDTPLGSQATKGMHFLAKFANRGAGCGVWTDGGSLTAIEAYPSACKGSAMIQGLRQRFSPLDHEDKEDALTCALVAHLFATRLNTLEAPGAKVPEQEGWIWVPRDAFPVALP